VTIVIDVERIGDFTKNIAGLAREYRERLSGGPFEDALKEIESLIDERFPAVIEILKVQNSEKASSILGAEQAIAKKSDAIIHDIITAKEESFSNRQAVTLALYARYLKRTNAHLTNVASSVVNPFPRIGFREKKKKSN